MWQYINIEVKRLFHTLLGFFLALFSTLLLVMSTIFLAREYLPKILEVKPFRIGLCVESDSMISNYVNQYLRQMESVENLIEFQEMRTQEMTVALQKGELAAGIVIPEKTVESIMDGSNIPIQVLMGTGIGQTERYLQQRLLTLLTECGAVMIDVPQAETLLLYEMQVENPQELGVTLDLFHFGLVIDRENWFKKEIVHVFGNVDIKEYYLAAGLTLLFLLWGLGSGSFFRQQEKNLPLLLERKGMPLTFQQGVRQTLYILLYLIPGILLILYTILRTKGIGTNQAMLIGTKIGLSMTILLCVAMLAMQCSFFFELAPSTASGIALNCIWGLVGFFGTGGILPTVFLPKTLTKICSVLPVGICMELLKQTIAGIRGENGKMVWPCFLWFFMFGIGGQLVFHGKYRSKERK